MSRIILKVSGSFFFENLKERGKSLQNSLFASKPKKTAKIPNFKKRLYTFANP